MTTRDSYDPALVDAGTYEVKFVKLNRWSILLDGKVLDGGFFSEDAAKEYMGQEYGVWA